LTIAALIHAYLIGWRVIEATDEKFAYTIIELDTKVTDHLLVKWLKGVVETNVVDFNLTELWMGHTKGEVAIVG
jgi:hypothetical protein